MKMAFVLLDQSMYFRAQVLRGLRFFRTPVMAGESSMSERGTGGRERGWVFFCREATTKGVLHNKCLLG